MCEVFCVFRSGYYAFVQRIGRPEPDADPAQKIQKCQAACDKTYGYLRMWQWLEKHGIHRNPKTILRVMKKYGLLAEIRRHRKWRQMGRQVHKYENLLNREFHAERPNAKWVTDISYIQTGQGVLYLSMIRDLYDNSIVAYKAGTQQTVSLVLDTIRLAMKSEKKKVAAELKPHSDQGFQYTSLVYFNLTKKYGITPSMSRRGNCYDNAMAENFSLFLRRSASIVTSPVRYKRQKI
jgi:transposase InsO family protein